jgi:hypothetical protein
VEVALVPKTQRVEVAHLAAAVGMVFLQVALEQRASMVVLQVLTLVAVAAARVVLVLMAEVPQVRQVALV